MLDVVAALGARTYPTSGEVVLEVHDTVRPDGDAAGTFLVAGGPDGATVARTGRPPDLALRRRGAVGRVDGRGQASPRHRRAGRIEERTAGALAQRTAMFASDPLPDTMTWF